MSRIVKILVMVLAPVAVVAGILWWRKRSMDMYLPESEDFNYTTPQDVETQQDIP